MTYNVFGGTLNLTQSILFELFFFCCPLEAALYLACHMVSLQDTAKSIPLNIFGVFLNNCLEFRYSGDAENVQRFCGKFIQETIYRISSESSEFCRRYYKKKIKLWSLLFWTQCRTVVYRSEMSFNFEFCL